MDITQKNSIRTSKTGIIGNIWNLAPYTHLKFCAIPEQVAQTTKMKFEEKTKMNRFKRDVDDSSIENKVRKYL